MVTLGEEGMWGKDIWNESEEKTLGGLKRGMGRRGEMEEGEPRNTLY